MVIKPLCLSFWSPPTIRPQAILIGKMIPEWIAQSVRPVMVTYASNGHWSIDIPIYTITPFALRGISNLLPPMRAYLRRRYQERIADYVIGIMKKHNVNLIFSFANPQESNIIGAIIKEKTGVPFVSHFSDPWYDNPAAPLSFWRAKRVLKQETRVIRNSDRAVFINASLRDMVMAKYPLKWQGKGAVVHHSFSPKDYPLDEEAIAENKQGDKFIFSYVGAFYKERNPEVIFRALQKAIEKHKDIAHKIVFQLVGCDSGYTDFSIDDVKALINKYRLAEIVTLVPRVDYRESLKYMQLADCLVMIDIRYPLGYALPSKLIDYAGSGSSIVGVANHMSPVADFLQKLGYRSFGYDEVDELALYLYALITGQVKTKRNVEFLEQFNVKSTTRELLDLFVGALSNSFNKA